MMGTNWAARGRALASSYICTYVPSFPSMFYHVTHVSLRASLPFFFTLQNLSKRYGSPGNMEHRASTATDGNG